MAGAKFALAGDGTYSFKATMSNEHKFDRALDRVAEALNLECSAYCNLAYSDPGKLEKLWRKFVRAWDRKRRK